MDILIFSWRGPGHPHEGGAEASTHYHAKGWVNAGHNVTLFTSYYPGAKQEEKIDGVHIKRYGSQIFGVHWEAFKWYLFGNHPKYDLVVDEFHGIPFFTPIYVRTKKLAFIHEITKEVWALNPWPFPFNLIPALIGRIFEPLIFQLFYRKIPFMTGAQSAKADLMLWGIPEKNITVIHHGFDKPKKIDFPKSKKKIIIFLGALSKDKGVEDALQAFSILSTVDRDFQFWVIGKGEEHYVKQLKLKVDKMSLNKKIKFWGFVSNDKKFELLAKAYLLVNPSVREGWGLVVIEAASVGTPTVGYNVAGLKDSIVNGKTGILCNQNPQACAKAILELAEDREKYQLFRKNCFMWCRKFSWEKSVKD
ncbi:MAG: glycosyltransferase family 4 protein [Actinobacteria bacterium]|nr:glycosyltransferase family 4 protein [Actinomycetota bacterium]